MFVLSHPLATRRVPALAAAVDRLFDDSFDRVFGTHAEPQSRTPAMDVVETDDAYTVTFDVPGASRETLHVAVEGRKVALTTVKPVAEAAPAAPTADAQPAAAVEDAPVAPKAAAPRTLYRERPAPVFARTVSLPAEVDQAASEARFENGVLTLVLAKRVKAGATQLRIA
jgi:HSP20 family protein